MIGFIGSKAFNCDPILSGSCVWSGYNLICNGWRMFLFTDGFKMFSFPSWSLRLSDVEISWQLVMYMTLVLVVFTWNKKDLIQWVLCKQDYLKINESLPKTTSDYCESKNFMQGYFPNLFFGYFCKCMLLSTWKVKEANNALMYSNSLFLLYFLRELVLLCDLSNFKTFGSEWNICNKELILGGQSDKP